MDTITHHHAVGRPVRVGGTYGVKRHVAVGAKADSGGGAAPKGEGGLQQKQEQIRASAALQLKRKVHRIDNK